jgi:transcriptional regulator with XRE-family HTH domain
MRAKRRSLAQRRVAVGFTQEQLAECLGVDPSTVRRWESGSSANGPKPWIRPKLARHLRISIDQLHELLTEQDRREDSGEAPVAYAMRHPASTDLVTVAHLREKLHLLDERYDSAPSTLLLAETGMCLGKVGFLGKNAPTGRLRRELRALEAEAATLMGKLVWDGSQRRSQSAAKVQFDRAVEAAHEIGDRAKEGLALLRKSFIALYGEKDPKTGLTLTMRTAELTRGVSNVLVGISMLHAAEAYAMLAQRSDCEQALLAADTYLVRANDADIEIDSLSGDVFGRVAGSCYLFLDDARKAQQILEDAAEESHPSKSQAILLGNLSLAHLRQNRPDDAAAVLHRVIDLVELNWGGGGLTLVFAACRELEAWRRGGQSAVVQDVRDRVMALIAAT